MQGAIAFFAQRGLEGSTRELAQELDIAQALLFRYFPTKEALVERVFDEVFVRRWNPEWEESLANRDTPLHDRLKRYFGDYARFILRSEWVRIFIHAGLSHSGLNQRYFARMRERHFLLIAREIRHAYAVPDPPNDEAENDEVELIWALHSSIFYIGVRKWVYDLPTTKDLERLIDLRVDAFLEGTPRVLRQRRPPTTPRL